MVTDKKAPPPLFKRLRRVIALLTLGAFVGLGVSEAFHMLLGKHVEAHCGICQIAHHTPALAQARVAVAPSHSFSRLSFVARIVLADAIVPDRRSRGPPAASSVSAAASV